MKVGHIYLDYCRDGRNGRDEDNEDVGRFVSLVESLDRLAINQHLLVADRALARKLHAMPFVTVGPAVTSPIMACCLMPEIDVVHVHDGKAEQAGLLLTLTRSIPFVLNVAEGNETPRNPLRRSILNRASFLIAPSEWTTESLIEKYRRSADAWSELPKNTNCW